MEHKLAIVGFGGMGNWHRERLEKLEAPRLAGIWDIKEARREYARSLGLFVYDSFEAVLADECICVVGNEEKIEEQKELFMETRSLF